LDEETTNGEKATFIIDEAVLEEAKTVVETKRFKSLNSFVEKAIKDKIGIIRREEIKKALVEASQDPMFLSDLRDVEYDFQFADFEYQGK